MTPATAAQAPAPEARTLESLQREVSEMEEGLTKLKTNRAAEQKNLDALRIEQGKTARWIAEGKAKPEAASALNRKIEESQAAIAGFDSLINPIQQKYDASFRELRALEAANKKAADLAEVENLRTEAAAILDTIEGTLKNTIGAEIARYTVVRGRLGRIMDTAAKTGTFPIPPTALAARDARNGLDKRLAVTLKTVQTMIGR